MIEQLRAAGLALLEVLLPGTCAACGGRVEAPGPVRRVSGLRWCDGPALCDPCESRLLRPELRVGHVTDGDLTLAVRAGRPTCAELVALVGAWKYRGRRGLARPLARLATTAWASDALPGRLTPIPLHRARRRERGFNQAAVLARLLGASLDVPTAEDVLVRTRSTAQQAKLDAREDARRRNVAGAFVARPPRAGEERGLTMVDDLVTSGATCLAAAAALARAGWRVRDVAAVGLATGAGALDTVRTHA